MKKNTLQAVFSMPDDIFYPTGTNVCVMVWIAHVPHDSMQETFFAYCKKDGFVKRKKLGRVDAFGKWESIEKEWLKLYRNKDVVDGLSARYCVGYMEEWLCEAYMQTDYSKLTQADFQQTVNDYFAYMVKCGEADLECKYERKSWHSVLDIGMWKEFRLEFLFNFSKGRRLTKVDIIPGVLNYLGAISENNGVREKIEADYSWEPNCITVNYNGSVGEAFYQSVPFWASDDVNVLYAKDFWEMNKYTAMFLITVIKANKYRFGYGRKWTMEKMKETVIRLPSQADGSPDFIYMEKYIKSLSYSDRI